MILLIDNYDSFSYNLYQMVGALEPEIKVIRNDAMTVEEIATLALQAIIISPGPGTCENAGVIISLVQQLGPTVPILGVCLGHQAIATAFGATVTYAKKLYHGKQSSCVLDHTSPLFHNLGREERVGRYHSLSVDPKSLPSSLTLTGWTEDGQVMAIQHNQYPIYGVQFHPESILTPSGKTMLGNFLTLAKDTQGATQ
ncbi:MAG: anthranilate synthase component [Sphaerochaeta sp.]|jgi:anthranilate synthase component 2|uniref:Aminodeoxychorismate/anthranilate synthase component II n=1 Tax=Sphaerochaeta halotolerans TaxID=2293840 RepID=A0A372MGU5_9SPIR|nr:aminodeoxychorismate/anthranilate synthase component II [Sphaerochaeta halotolerans]MBG0767814.1 aminodeoxychorismate/anthranilate synthase component II [Spirochaetaceae bacterium]MDK2859486.1 anthranilate synthase component [Sphaerochaeta sp.]MDN5333501.1 anthranilate synthase component [Sphaerochaeta sp.]RFU94964.1 aminodeoxychorismate/anthranilate synthase component II [Sphaerochaeta halotolerans]